MFKRIRERFIRQRHPPLTGVIRLSQRRLYILPTRSGACFVFLCLLTLIGAINYQLSLAFFLTFLLAGAAHAAMLHTYANLLGLELQALAVEPVFAGEIAHFPLLLSSRKKRYGVILRSDSQLTNPCSISEPGLRTELSVQAPQRGWLSLPRLTIECRQPTGWFRSWSYLHLAVRCLVYPSPEISPPNLPGSALSGQGSAQIDAGDEDFAGLRAYQPGDARRLIAWKQMAHSDTLLSRHFQGANQSEIMLDWQNLISLNTEEKLSRLCAWVLQAEQGGFRYALHLPERQISAGNGPAHCQECLTALALHPGTTP